MRVHHSVHGVLALIASLLVMSCDTGIVTAYEEYESVARMGAEELCWSTQIKVPLSDTSYVIKVPPDYRSRAGAAQIWVNGRWIPIYPGHIYNFPHKNPRGNLPVRIVWNREGNLRLINCHGYHIRMTSLSRAPLGDILTPQSD